MMIRIPLSAIRVARIPTLAALIGIAIAIAAAVSLSPPFGTWTRLSADPIVSPKATNSNLREHLIPPS
jgi:hypothetical protein